MPQREIAFIVYVSDLEESIDFYSSRLGIETTFTSPRYVTFGLAAGVELALWTAQAESLKDQPVRTSEVCMNLSGGEEAITQTYQDWVAAGVEIIEEPHKDVFGLTFVAADPDGNRVRVAPVD